MVSRAIANTETIANLARLGPAENGRTLDFFIELTMICMMFEEKALRISCPEYVKD